MFKIITVGRNAEQYIPKCIGSVISQRDPDWQMQVILDPPEDATGDVAIQMAATDKRVSVVVNKVRKYGMENQVTAIGLLKPKDEDILCWLDADDWLTGNDSLEIVRGYYDYHKDVLVTHGSWESWPPAKDGDWHNNEPYPENDFKKNIRYAPWRAAHLRTMKYKVFRCIKEADLKDEQGRWFTTAFDCAVMFPALEMAGFERVKFIKEKIHCYNRETPFGDWKIVPMEQAAVFERLKTLPQYPIRESFGPCEINREKIENWLKIHEKDIAVGNRAYGNLRGHFENIVGRLPE